MAKGSRGGAAAEGQRNMTLTEVSKRTGISMPTLQKYKKRHSDRIPSAGKGRSQRYPEESLKVFAQLREENMARRGRPRKNAAAPASGPGRRRAKSVRRGRPRKAAKGGEGLLTLTQIAQRTKISYPTLLRYVKTALDKLPHVGTGRRRRFKANAVPIFQQLRAASRSGRRPGTKTARRGRRSAAAPARRGRPPGSGVAARAALGALSRLTTAVERLAKRLARVESELKKPMKVVRR